jgi:hypothetical protein
MVKFYDGVLVEWKPPPFSHAHVFETGAFAPLRLFS